MMRSTHNDPSIYGEGYEAYIMGWGNPYEAGTQACLDWAAGWEDAHDEEMGLF
jgi:hypothetical protein